MLFQNKQTLDILGLCETLLSEQISNSAFYIEGFNFEGFDFERKYRILRTGGGIVVYISNNMSY